MYPVSGGFYTLVCRFLDTPWVGMLTIAERAAADLCHAGNCHGLRLHPAGKQAPFCMDISVLTPSLPQWAVTLPLELTAAGFTIQYWDSQKTVPIAVWITIFAAIISE